MRLIIALILLSLTFSTFAHDLSERYLLLKKSKLTSAEIKELKKHKIILVPGVLAESFSKGKNKLSVEYIFEEGFSEQISAFNESGLDFQFLDFDTEKSPAENAKEIISALEAADKPVLLYSHSKGGLDTLEAFRQRPDLVKKISGWVTVQSPLWGSKIASLMFENKPIKTVGTSLFEWMGGDVGGFSSLTIEEREQVMNSADVKNLLLTLPKKMRILNYASFKENRLGVDSPLEIFRNIDQNLEGWNDGVVSVNSALMSQHGYAVDSIVESDVDHLMTMTKYRPDSWDLLNWTRKEYSQKAHTIALLRLLLEKK
jgi:triacylglycerol lipase